MNPKNSLIQTMKIILLTIGLLAHYSLAKLYKTTVTYTGGEDLQKKLESTPGTNDY